MTASLAATFRGARPTAHFAIEQSIHYSGRAERRETRLLVLQVTLCTSQQIEFCFQFADDHVIPVQFDTLQSFHTLLKTELESLENLNWSQLWQSGHAVIIFAFCSPVDGNYPQKYRPTG